MSWIGSIRRRVNRAALDFRVGSIPRAAAAPAIALLFVMIVLIFTHHNTTTISTGATAGDNNGVVGVAFFLQVSKDNCLMLERTLTALYLPPTSGNYYLIHLDTRVDLSSLLLQTPRLRNELLTQPNVALLEPRDTLTWGGISLILNTIRGLRHLLLLRATHTFTHLIPLSPSAYPLVRPHTFRTLLSSLQPHATLGHFESAASYAAAHELRAVHNKFSSLKLDAALFNASDGLLSLQYKPPSPPSELRELLERAIEPNSLVKGEAWMILSHAAASWLAHGDAALRWTVRLANVFAPDEVFAQLALLDQTAPEHVRHALMNDHMYFIEWKRGSRHPETLTGANGSSSWAALEASGALFARKFAWPASKEVLARIDEQLVDTPLHLERVKARLARACNAADPACRDTAWRHNHPQIKKAV